MTDTLILHLPFLCAASLPPESAAAALLFDPGLPEAEQPHAGQEIPANYWRPANLPFAPKEAALLVRELLDQARELAAAARPASDHLDAPAARDLPAETPPRDSALSPDEVRALRAFAGNADSDAPTSDRARRRRESAQKMLLLARNLEEQCLEAELLAARFSRVRAQMGDNLGVEHSASDSGPDSSSDAASAASSPLEGDPLANLPYSAELPDFRTPLVLRNWESVLNAMYIFAPEATFFVSHPALLASLEERGACFTPVPGSPWQEAELPLRRALGLAHEDPGTQESSPLARFRVPL